MLREIKKKAEKVEYSINIPAGMKVVEGVTDIATWMPLELKM